MALLALALAGSTVLVPAAASAAPARPAAPASRVVVTGGAGPVAADAVETAAAAVRAAGGTVLDRLPLVAGVSAELPPGAVLPPSVRVVPDRPLTVAAAPARAVREPSPAVTGPRGTLGLGAPAGEGRGRTVAVVDTGIAEVAGLPEVRHVDVSGAGPGDGYGHGTFVAGLVAGTGVGGVPAGIAPGADLLDVRVADNDGSTSLVTVLRGLQVVAAHPEVDVLNLSLSSGSPLPYQLDPLTIALETLWKRGVTVVVPAGNDGGDRATIGSPGSDPVLLTVGGLDEHGTAARAGDTVAAWSSRGPAPQKVAKPDLVAPGASVVSLRAPGSAIDTAFPGSRVGTTGFRGSGTSFSTAVTSGAVAALMADRALTPDQVKAVLTGTAYDARSLGSRRDSGAGGLDVAAAIVAKAPTADMAARQNASPADVVPSDAQAWGDLLDEIMGDSAQSAANSWSALSPASRTWAQRAWTDLDPELRTAGIQAWSSRNWAGADAEQWAARDWAARVWASRNWATGDWASRDWAGRTWTGRTWTGRTWTSRSWTGRTWTGRTWTSRSWAGGDWAGRTWTGRTWTAVNWG